jgi:hypothetical protein
MASYTTICVALSPWIWNSIPNKWRQAECSCMCDSRICSNHKATQWEVISELSFSSASKWFVIYCDISKIDDQSNKDGSTGWGTNDVITAASLVQCRKTFVTSVATLKRQSRRGTNLTSLDSHLSTTTKRTSLLHLTLQIRWKIWNLPPVWMKI